MRWARHVAYKGEIGNAHTFIALSKEVVECFLKVYCNLVYENVWNDMHWWIYVLYRPVVTICTVTLVAIRTVQWSLYVAHSGHYMYRTLVTIRTSSGHYM